MGELQLQFVDHNNESFTPNSCPGLSSGLLLFQILSWYNALTDVTRQDVKCIYLIGVLRRIRPYLACTIYDGGQYYVVRKHGKTHEHPEVKLIEGCVSRLLPFILSTMQSYIQQVLTDRPIRVNLNSLWKHYTEAQ